MMRRRGFTLIELLVVIAIIGILAAMLFPVFARARESARKTQCLSNVKNIAIAINMYLADWDKWIPKETNRVVIDYFNGKPGKGGSPYVFPDVCNHVNHANPYLRSPVILEEYIRSREIWKCPSAKTMNGAAFIVPMGRDGNWMNNYIDAPTYWGRQEDPHKYGPCYCAWPTGWGGEITDSFIQDTMAQVQLETPVGADFNVFIVGIGINDNMRSLTNISAINDPSRYVACADSGRQLDIWDANGIAFPDTCGVAFCDTGTSCGIQACNAGVDWDNCPDTQTCGIDADELVRFYLEDPSFQKTFARHLGGSNIGYVDGHARWSLYKAILTQSEPFKDPYFQGICSCWLGNGTVPANPFA